MKALIRIIAISVIVLMPNICEANILPATAYPLHIVSGYKTEQVYLGRTLGERETDIGFELAGYVKTLPVNDGQSVEKGQLLAKMDVQRLQQQRKILSAERNAIIPELKLARKNAKRQQHLLKRDLGSQIAYDREHTRALSLKARLARVEANLGRNQIELNKSVLYAPFHAVVLARYIHQGAYVQAGQRVLRLQQSDIREAHIGVPQRIAATLKKGECFAIQIYKKSYEGYISQIVPQLSTPTQTVRIIFKLKTKQHIINGELAYFSVSKLHKIKGAWIPTQALLEGRRGTWQIYTLEPVKGKPASYQKVIPLTVNVMHSDGNKSYITGNLSKVKHIIAQGVHKYAPNTIVKLTHAKQS